MSEQQDIKTLADLNAVAVNELKLALVGETQLQPAWRDAALRLFEKGTSRDLEAFQKLIEEDTNA